MALAAFSDVYDGSYVSRLQKVAEALFGARYVTDADMVAKKVAENVKEKPVEFCQGRDDRGKTWTRNRSVCSVV